MPTSLHSSDGREMDNTLRDVYMQMKGGIIAFLLNLCGGNTSDIKAMDKQFLIFA